MFGDHTYLSGITKSLSNHFKEIAVNIDKRTSEVEGPRSVLDVGSNDGTQLKHFIDLGQVLGIESSKRISDIANKMELKQ